MENRKKLIESLNKLFPYGHSKFVDLSIDEMQLYFDKNHDYAFGGDSLGNFKRVANILSQYPNLDLGKPEVVALVYMFKQLDAAMWMMSQGHEAKIEGTDGRLEDVHVYAKIMRILLGENG